MTPGPDAIHTPAVQGRTNLVSIKIMMKAILPEVLPCPNRTRHEWARWDAFLYAHDPDPLFDEFRSRGASFVTDLSFIDDGLWGFEVADSDGYVLAFARLSDQAERDGRGQPARE